MSCGLPLLLVWSESLLTCHAAQDLGHQAMGEYVTPSPQGREEEEECRCRSGIRPSRVSVAVSYWWWPSKDVPPLGGSTCPNRQQTSRRIRQPVKPNCPRRHKGAQHHSTWQNPSGCMSSDVA